MAERHVAAGTAPPTTADDAGVAVSGSGRSGTVGRESCQTLTSDGVTPAAAGRRVDRGEAV